MILFVNAQGPVKIKLACSGALLSPYIVTRSNGFIKGLKCFFFMRVAATNVLLKINYLQRRVETQYRNVIFITPSNIKHFIERSSVTS